MRVALLMLLLAGCTISTQGLATDCATDSDCIAVYEGPACGGAGCVCPNSPIATKALEEYQRLEAAARAGCSEPRVNLCACVHSSAARCDRGTCRL